MGKLRKSTFLVKKERKSKKYFEDNEAVCEFGGIASSDKRIICKNSTKNLPYIAIP